MNASIALNVLKLLSGRLIIQGLSFLTIPLVTRLFLPDHFGVLQVFNSLTAIAIVISGLKYEMSIPLARNDTEASASLTLSSLIMLFSSALIVLSLLAGGDRLVHRFKLAELESVLWWLLPLVVLLGSLKKVLEFWAVREQQFGAVAWTDVLAFSGERLLHILWGLSAGASVTGLLSGQVVGLLIGAGLLFMATKTALFSKLSQSVPSLGILQQTAARHKKFPLFNTWSVFLNTFSAQLPALLLGASFSMQIVGYYALAHRTIKTPLNMLRNSIANVFFPEAAKAYHTAGTLAPIVRFFFLRQAQIAAFPLTVLGLFGQPLFLALFGREWAEAGLYAQVLSFWYYCVFLNMPKVFIVLERQEISLLLNVLSLCIRGASLLVGVVLFSSPLICLLFFTISSCGLLLLSISWQLKLSEVSLGWAFKNMAQYALLSFSILLPAKFIFSLTGNIIHLSILTALGALAYLSLLIKTDREIDLFMRQQWERFGIPAAFQKFFNQ